MTETILTLIYAILVLGLGVAFLSMEYYSRKIKVGPAPSTPWMRKAMMEELTEVLQESGKESPVIYELGAGWGALGIAAAKANPQAQIIGLELSPVPLLIAKFRAWIGGHKNCSFERADFFERDLSDADVILSYLLIVLLEKLEPKLEKELKPGSTVICNTFAPPNWTPTKTRHVGKMLYDFNIYVFKMKKNT